MHILITGGTGFIGRALCRHFAAQSPENKRHRITILTRNANRARRTMADMYGDNIAFIEHLADINFLSHAPVDAVINLAGATIGKRWSKAYKNTLMASRVDTTEKLVAWMGQCAVKPKKFISASAIGYYGEQAQAVVTEDTQPNPSFTHQLCDAWEHAACTATAHGVATTILRLGVVLGEGAGMFKQTLPAFKLGAGGRVGDGRQYFSWVHIADVVAVIAFLITRNEPARRDAHICNLTAPNPVTNAEWTRALAATLKRPAFCHVPAGLIRLLFGEMGEALLLGSARVVPERLLAAGFVFQYADVHVALNNILNRPS